MAAVSIAAGSRAGRIIIGLAIFALITAVMAAVLVPTLPAVIADFRKEIADGHGTAVVIVVVLAALLTLILAGALIWAFRKDGDRITALFLPREGDDAR